MSGDRSKRTAQCRAHTTEAQNSYATGLSLCRIDGDYNTAAKYFSKAIALKNDRAVYFAARASCYAKLGRGEESYHDYVTAIRLNPVKASYRASRGSALVQLGR
ncbi:unnamed protein product, partial [Phaeothamnion confervicola]